MLAGNDIVYRGENVHEDFVAFQRSIGTAARAETLEFEDREPPAALAVGIKVCCKITTLLDTGNIFGHPVLVTGARQYSLAELATEAATPARTIRYYIASGLMEGPVGAGRGAYYSGEHLRRLAEIRKLRGEGLMLAEIGAVLGGGEAARLPAGRTWVEYEIGEDVKVLVREGGSPWRVKQIRDGIALLARKVSGPAGPERS
jgi:DNA-binding transcriptional MerR regulator